MIYLILSFCICICVYININLFKKVEKLTDQLELSNIDTAKLYVNLESCFSEMKVIDAKGGFQTDDEVGFIFKNLKEVLDELEIKHGEINV